MHNYPIALINIDFTVDEPWTPLRNRSQVHAIIHAANTIPSLADRMYFSVREGYEMDLFFGKTTGVLMGAPYETDCIIYQNEDLVKSQSKLDCMDKCMIDSFKSSCHCLPGFLNHRKDIVTNDDKF